VFDFVADYRNVQPMLEGVTRWEPIGKRTRGKGATFRVEMSALGIPMGDTLQLDAWKRPTTIGWRSVGRAMDQTGRWQFTPRDGGVETELRIVYNPPVGLVGEVVANAIDGLVRRRLEHALRRMRDLIEADGQG
jgi:hypothetical protein